ncbi:hypothetical protein ACWDO0_12545 [Nocardia rhamnosiphila]
MRVGIFGATGGTGHLVQRPLAAGRHDRAVVDDPAVPPGANRPGLGASTGEAMAPDAIGPAVADPDAAVPALGPAVLAAPAEPATIGHSLSLGY